MAKTSPLVKLLRPQMPSDVAATLDSALCQHHRGVRADNLRIISEIRATYQLDEADLHERLSASLERKRLHAEAKRLSESPPFEGVGVVLIDEPPRRRFLLWTRSDIRNDLAVHVDEVLSGDRPVPDLWRTRFYCPPGVPDHEFTYWCDLLRGVHTGQITPGRCAVLSPGTAREHGRLPTINVDVPPIGFEVDAAAFTFIRPPGRNESENARLIERLRDVLATRGDTNVMNPGRRAEAIWPKRVSPFRLA